MKHLKGAQAPFFFSLCAPRLRDDALLTSAIEALEAGHYADALLATENVCRRFPTNSIPAILRAKILHACRPELSAKAWYRAWTCDPESAALQDAMLKAWLDAGAAASVAELGPAFLPARCRAGQHGSLVGMLRQAGMQHIGACWKSGDAIEGMLFSPAPAPGAPHRLRLVLADELGEFHYVVPADGSRFRLACPRPAGVWSLAFQRADGSAPQLLHGSPLVFATAAADRASGPRGTSAAPVSIIIPVYRDRALVQACIDSVLASLPHNRTRAELVVVDDASPEPALSAWLDQLAAGGRIALLRNPHNLGFIETVNRGLRHHPGHDALLLNADTLVHGDWIDRLSAALYSAADIASVTPWSNNGEISSFPKIATATPSPDAAQLAAIDDTAAALRRAGHSDDVELPSCCGFAMLMRRSVIDQVGMLDGVGLIRGYGEEVDWCLRARAAGFRHLLATAVFVAHTGTVSFRFEKTLRVRQNRNVLASRYPDYLPEYRNFVSDDPLDKARGALRRALSDAGSGWLDNALRLVSGAADLARTLPAALPSAFTRIAVWQHQAGTQAASKVLALARLIASRDPALPRLRLLVIGEPMEALWHTGIVDAMPSSVWQESALLTDAALVGLCGCSILLSESDVTAALGIAQLTLDDTFDPQAWLSSISCSPELSVKRPLPLKKITA